MKTGKIVSRVKGWIGGLSIAKKIGYGYSLAIGLAVLGTTAGLMVGDYYQKQAQEQLRLVQNQYSLLKEFAGAILSSTVGCCGRKSDMDAVRKEYISWQYR